MALREHKFNFVMTSDEKRRLEAVARSEDRTAGGWLRSAINQAFTEKFGDESTKRRKRK
jgi:hypothetical protein